MSTGIWRERRLALHLGAIIAVLALFVVLSNSLDLLREFASARMSGAAFLTTFYLTYDTALGITFFWLIHMLQEFAAGPRPSSHTLASTGRGRIGLERSGSGGRARPFAHGFILTSGFSRSTR